MATQNIVKITSRGMITIPFALRKKFNLIEGMEIAIIEDEGSLCLIPLRDIEEMRKDLPTLEEFSRELDKANAEELELEK
ncbi:MAG TPA: AbrB/MazE/SpoVT family DNA-binding domain-containing protein [Candidatus Lokiarchaeia archaeon]|nr:AbrB/MazE/SpoVT family DNA-binding domain-containing protein [Candidatus Lokiarchaeia archaeon]